jgi:ABC-2 type transport system ATP-binding protein
MDEPTDGLDPNQKYEVRTMIREMAADKAILLSTHILEEVQEVCSRAIIIAGGKIVADDTPMGLRAKSPVHGAVRFTARKDLKKDILGEARMLPGISSVDMVEENATDVTLRIFPQDLFAFKPEAAFLSLHEKGYSIESFFVEQGRLDEVFRMVTTGESVEREAL